MLFNIETNNNKPESEASSEIVNPPKKVEPEKRKIRLGWLIFSLLFIALAIGLMYARKELPWFAPFYSTKVYPIWQSTLGRFSGIFSFSLSEAILYALPVIFILDILVIAISKKIKIWGLFKRIIVLASLLAFLYSANCGVNYYNTPFVLAERIPLIKTPETPQEEKVMEELLIKFCEYVSDELNKSSQHAASAPAISDDADLSSVTTFSYGYYDDEGYLNQEKYYPSGDALATVAVDSMQNLGTIYPSLSGYYPAPKPLYFSRPFSNMGVTGVYSPFTIEANYNKEMTPYNLPFTACHELSHLKGYMDEGEANYIGWLACINSYHFAFQRSGYLMAWVYAGNELSRVNSKEFSRIRKTLPKDAIRELEDNNDFWEKYETKASEIQDQINDAYLQYNGLELGVQSYDQVVTLMLSWYLSSR